MKHVSASHPYEGHKVYGPYVRKDGRKHVVLVSSSGDKTTVSYPKFLMETSIGRRLSQEETVDHIDRDFSNDEISNLQILSRREHSSIDCFKLQPQDFECGICNKKFTLSGKKLSEAFYNRMKGKSGPYCGRSCAGKASHVGQRAVTEVKKEKIRIEKHAGLMER